MQFKRCLAGGHHKTLHIIKTHNSYFYGTNFPAIKQGPPPQSHMAYLRVHSLAVSLYLDLSFLYILATSGTRGSSGLGSHSSEQIDSNTFEMVRAGLHCERNISKHILPFELIFG